MTLRRPIFVIGVGRSGSTIIFEALAHHEELGWFSNYSNKFPDYPYMTFIHRLFFGKMGQKKQGQKLPFLNRFLPKTSEAYKLWSKLFFEENFGRLSLFSKIPSSVAINKANSYISKLLRAQGKNRFIAKLTGPPRINYLQAAFPDAIYIDIIRDPCATIASLMRTDFWEAKGKYTPAWDGILNEKEIRIWEEYDSSPLVVTALQWNAISRATHREQSETNAQLLRIKYEDFINNPMSELKKILSFAGLKDSQKIEKYIFSMNYESTNYKYKELLKQEEMELIRNITSEFIAQDNY